MLVQPHELVEAHLYESEDAVIQDALRHLLRNRPQLRIQVAVHRYRQDGLSLAKAAAIAGVSWAQMADILREAGVELQMGPVSLQEALDEVAALETDPAE